jgi:hypothetical protein
MRALVTFVAVSSLVACKAAPQAGPDLAPLERRIAALEKRVTTFEQAAAASSASASASAAATAWGCAAKCITKYSCSSNGDNDVQWKSLTASGPSAIEAFQRIDDQCKDALVIQGVCSEGHFVKTDATLVNACVRQ